MSAKRITGTLLFLFALFAGCATRSISNSDPYSYGGEYNGELSELAVLGSSANDQIQEQDIQAALNDASKLSLQRGEKVVLVQSGARFPDQEMMDTLGGLFEIVPLSGVPGERRGGMNPAPSTERIEKALRLAAARAGAKSLIVYWGILETGRVDQATKVISWVPLAGRVVPDESQEMRIRIKAAIIDVASGKWMLMMPEPHTDTRLSAKLNRQSSDQRQVAVLKKEAYRGFADELVKKMGV